MQRNMIASDNISRCSREVGGAHVEYLLKDRSGNSTAASSKSGDYIALMVLELQQMDSLVGSMNDHIVCTE